MGIEMQDPFLPVVHGWFCRPCRLECKSETISGATELADNEFPVLIGESIGTCCDATIGKEFTDPVVSNSCTCLSVIFTLKLAAQIVSVFACACAGSLKS